MIPLVLVHGFLGGSAQWEALAGYYDGQRDLIAVDLPGFGKNADLAALVRIEDMADWVIDTLRGKGVDRYDLLGHSMGGMIVQEIARRNPHCVEHLILYSTGAIGILPGRFETIETSKARAQRDGAQATARRISATWFLHGEKDPAYAGCARIAVRAKPAAIAAGLDAMQGWTGQDHLAQVRARTLVIWGDRDRTYPWSQTETLWRGIPDCSLAVVPGCAHAVHLEKPEIFCRLVGDFLTSPIG